jgi:uncharacterized protein DUF4245
VSEQAGRYPRTFPGLVGALVVLLVAVMAFVAFRALVRGDVPDPVRDVAYADSLRYARTESSLHVLAPDPVPQGWRVTSVRYTPGPDESWHLGMLTEDGRYVGLEQADRSVSAMVEEFVDEAADPGPPVVVAGRRWQSWSDAGGDHALVRRSAGTTTVVVGSGSADDVARLAGSLA